MKWHRKCTLANISNRIDRSVYIFLHAKCPTVRVKYYLSVETINNDINATNCKFTAQNNRQFYLTPDLCIEAKFISHSNLTNCCSFITFISVVKPFQFLHASDLGEISRLTNASMFRGCSSPLLIIAWQIRASGFDWLFCRRKYIWLFITTTTILKIPTDWAVSNRTYYYNISLVTVQEFKS